ncbi:MAG: DUF2442 domain-containing protein [Bacteroidales bacterium]|nr:DUF2442 domain-containing protein [Bacteroidales bacterium]
MFIEVIKAQYVGLYTLRLWFNDHTEKVINLKKYLKGEIYQPLKSDDFFRKFQIKFNTIEWPNGADFAPEFLYANAE